MQSSEIARWRIISTMWDWNGDHQSFTSTPNGIRTRAATLKGWSHLIRAKSNMLITVDFQKLKSRIFVPRAPDGR